MNKKQVIAWLVVAAIGFIGWVLPQPKTRTTLEAQSTQSSATIVVPYMAKANTPADANQYNLNNTTFKNAHNTVVADILNIFTDFTQKGNNETITGMWGFSAVPTTTEECDAINEICNYQSVVRDSGNQTITGTKTFSSSPISSEECDASGELCPYQSVVRDAGDQTIGGVKTFSDPCIFSSALTLSTTCSSSNHSCPKSYIDAGLAAVSAGGCSVGSGAPAGACSAGACYYDITTATAPIGYLCYGSDMTTWVKVDQTTITGNLTVNGTSTFNNDITVGMSHTIDLGGNKATNAGDPVSAQDLLTLTYFNSNIGAGVWGSGSDGAATISMNTTLTGDKYYTDLTIDSGSTLTLNGYSVHVSGTFTWNGSVAAGNGANASGKTGGVNTRGSLPVINGVNGGSKGSSTNSNITGNAGQSCNVDSGGGNGVSDGGNSGGTGWLTVLGDVYSATVLPRAVAFGHYAGSASGDGSVWNGTHAANTGGDGGGSGANGQTAQIIAKNIIFGGASAATGLGGNGANGGNGVCDGDGMAEGGAVGGDGGSGSLFELVYQTKTGSLSSTTFTGGTAGTGGTGCGGGGNGNNGTAGNAGAVVEVDL